MTAPKSLNNSYKPIHALLLSLGLLTGVLMTAQLSSPAPAIVDPYEPLIELQESINLLSGDQANLQEKIAAARLEIEKLEGLIVGGERKKLLEQLKRELGLTEVSDAGVTVTLDDRALDSERLGEAEPVCYAADLRDIVNILRVAGSTALSINGQRVIDTTSIICVGQSVLVNNVRMLPPFTILAASTESPDQLVTYLETDKFLPDLHERSRRKEVRFTIQKSGTVQIPVYKGNLESKFITAL